MALLNLDDVLKSGFECVCGSPRAASQPKCIRCMSNDNANKKGGVNNVSGKKIKNAK